jgi:hypothetical protein
MQAAAGGGLGRYDLLAALQTRVLADAASASGPSAAAAAAAVARLNHRLQVLAHYLSATAAANKRPSHATRAAAGGRLLALTVSLQDAGGNGGAAAAAAGGNGGNGGNGGAGVTLRLHGNATLKDATAAAVAALASDPRFAPSNGGAMPGTFEWRLKPVSAPPPAYALTAAHTLPKLPPFMVPQLPFCAPLVGVHTARSLSLGSFTLVMC